MNKTMKRITFFIIIFIITILISLTISIPQINKILNVKKELEKEEILKIKISEKYLKNNELLNDINELKVELYNIKDFEDNKKELEDLLNKSKSELNELENNIVNLLKEIEKQEEDNNNINEYINE